LHRYLGTQYRPTNNNNNNNNKYVEVLLGWLVVVTGYSTLITERTVSLYKRSAVQ
jgi:hypothetical protein